MNFFANACYFLKALFLNPRTTGAVLPSSKYLSRKMASYIQPTESEMILELGPGTGAVTQAILNRGVLPHNLIALEISSHLSAQLREEFPAVCIIEGDATELSSLISNKNIRTIISSLPLRSFTDNEREKIFSEISKVLLPHGKFIQFTYSMKTDDHYYPSNFKLIDSSIILRNIPPARVTVFQVNPG